MRPGITVAPRRVIVWEQGRRASACPICENRPSRIAIAETTGCVESIVRMRPFTSARSLEPAHVGESAHAAFPHIVPLAAPAAAPASTLLMNSRRKKLLCRPSTNAMASSPCGHAAYDLPSGHGTAYALSRKITNARLLLLTRRHRLRCRGHPLHDPGQQ